MTSNRPSTTDKRCPISSRSHAPVPNAPRLSRRPAGCDRRNSAVGCCRASASIARTFRLAGRRRMPLGSSAMLIEPITRSSALCRTTNPGGAHTVPASTHRTGCTWRETHSLSRRPGSLDRRKWKSTSANGDCARSLANDSPERGRDRRRKSRADITTTGSSPFLVTNCGPPFQRTSHHLAEPCFRVLQRPTRNSVCHRTASDSCSDYSLSRPVRAARPVEGDCDGHRSREPATRRYFVRVAMTRFVVSATPTGARIVTRRRTAASNCGRSALVP